MILALLLQLFLDLAGTEITDTSITLHLESSPLVQVEWVEGCEGKPKATGVSLTEARLTCSGTYPEHFELPVVIQGRDLNGNTVYLRDTIGR